MASQQAEPFQHPALQASHRSSSCQLPAQPTGTARALHRPSQSCDVDVATRGVSKGACTCSSFRGGSEGSLPDYRGAKVDKQRPGCSAYVLATLLSVCILLIPAGCLARYSIASLAGHCSQQCGVSFTISTLRMGGADGRHLSHLEEGTMASTLGLIEADAMRLASTGKEAAVSATLSLPQQGPGGLTPALPASNMLFVTWIAFGDFGDGGFHTHNFHTVDMRWAEVVKQSHPGCRIGLILDQDTQLEQPELVDFLHRLTIDKKVYGRNEYNDFYHWTARYSMLEKLQAEGNDGYNVVFLDPDIYVLDDIQEVFENGAFDYATTISENPEQPVNGAMHFVRARHYGSAIDVLKGVLSLFQLKPEMGFTAGQQAYSDFFELTLNKGVVRRMQDEAVADGLACNKVKEGEFNICYVICARYNFWEDCTDNPEMVVVPDKVEDYVAAHVKVLHFIAYRKLGMQRVYEAYMADGLQGAYAAWASLPHTEDGFKADPSFATAA